MAAKLRLLGARLIVAPFKPTQSDSGIHYDMSRQDDRKRWTVLQVGPGVKEIKPGDRILTTGNEEPDYEFSDGIRIVNDKCVVMVWQQVTTV